MKIRLTFTEFDSFADIDLDQRVVWVGYEGDIGYQLDFSEIEAVYNQLLIHNALADDLLKEGD